MAAGAPCPRVPLLPPPTHTQVLEHIYVGRSIDVGNPAASKRYESMTFDGPGGSVTTTVASLSSNGTDGAPQILTTTVPGRAPGPWAPNISTYIGASVAVLYGPGLGGLARVTGITPTDATWATAASWTLDPPLLTAPEPGVSVVNIGPYRGGFIWEAVSPMLRCFMCAFPASTGLYSLSLTQDTYLNDTTWQLWAQASDIVLAGSYFQARVCVVTVIKLACLLAALL